MIRRQFNVVPHSADKVRMMYGAKKSHSIEMLARLIVKDYGVEGFDFVKRLMDDGYKNEISRSIGHDIFGLDEDGFYWATMTALRVIGDGEELVTKTEVCWIELTTDVDIGQMIVVSGTTLHALHEVDISGREFFLFDHKQIPGGKRHQLAYIEPTEAKLLEVFSTDFDDIGGD